MRRRGRLHRLMAGVAAGVALAAAAPAATPPDGFERARREMVTTHIAAEGVTNARVLEAMRTVPRHLFVSPSLQRFAYLDQSLDIGFKQTISPPFIVAYMTEVLDPQPTDTVLEIGTGSGYQAAVLSGLVEEVSTVEIVEPLGRRAAELLERLGCANVHCRIGDGFAGWPERAPFDKIIVTCSPESVPEPLVAQLEEGGRMIIPLGERYQQVFHLLEKRDGRLEQTRLVPTLFVPMTGTMEEIRRTRPDPAHPRLVNGDFEADDDGDGLADGWHYQRRSRLVDAGTASGGTCICFENDVAGRTAHMLQGFALDGSRVPEMTVSWSHTAERIEAGGRPEEVPFIAVHFFDGRRVPCGRVVLGPFADDQPEWRTTSRRIRVPGACREAIIQAGLNGATGTLRLDDLSITP